MNPELMAREATASPLGFSEKTQTHEKISPRVIHLLVERGVLRHVSQVGVADSSPDAGGLRYMNHGRASTSDEPFMFDPFYASDRPSDSLPAGAYLTPHYEDAQGFATERANYTPGSTPKVHRAYIGRENAYFVNASGKIDMSGIGTALEVPVSDVFSLDAKYAADNQAVYDLVNGVLTNNAGLIDDKKVEAILSGLPRVGNVDPVYLRDYTQNILRASNVRRLVHDGSIGPAIHQMTTGKPIVDGDKTYHLSTEYIEELCRRCGIVGVYFSTINSISLGKKIYDVHAVRDASDLLTIDQVELRRKQRSERVALLGGVATRLAHAKQPQDKTVTVSPSTPQSMNEVADRINKRQNIMTAQEALALRDILVDPYSSPHTIVERAREIDSLRLLLDSHSGVWEGYTVGEHTEAVLSIFEKYMADMLPAAVLPLFKTALFVQDLGKGYGRDKQEVYNHAVAMRVLQDIGLTRPDAEFIAGLNRACAYMHAFEVNGERKQLDVLFKDLAMKAQASGFMSGTLDNMALRQTLTQCLSILSICDGAAYTAHSRYRRNGTKLRMHAQRSFDDSFQTTTSRIRRKPKK